MLPPKMPRMRNNKSHNLELFLSFALLTIQMVIRETIKTIIRYTNEPTPTNWRFSGVCNTLAMPKTEQTMPAIHKMTIIQVKKLAMLYITLEAFSIFNSPFFKYKYYISLNDLTIVN